MTAWSYYGDDRPDVQALVTASGSRVLDVGCGEGALAYALKRAGADYVAGIELEPRAAAIAAQRIDQVVQGSAMDASLPFKEGEFDYLIFADVLEHLPDPDQALHRLLPLLSPTGRLIVSVPNIRFYSVLARLVFDRWAYASHGIRDRTHLRIFTRRILERMLAEQGLEIERMTRNFRLFDDQTEIGRFGALATRLVRRTLAPAVFPNLLAYQYVVAARRR